MGVPTRITRHNLGGGKIGRQLHKRSDLEQYHKGNFEQTNFLPTPYGGIVRREPATWLAAIPPRYDGLVPTFARGFKFVRSADDKYSVILIGYSDGTSEFQIFTDDGTLLATVACPYRTEDMFEIDGKQINDVMILTHNNYPPANLIRQSETSWSYVERDIIGGPFLDQNDNHELIMSTSISGWHADINYQVEDRIKDASLTSIAVNWAGTVISQPLESTLTADALDLTGVDPYYKTGSVDVTFSADGDDFKLSAEEIEYPYLLVRVDQAYDPAVVTGLEVALSLIPDHLGNDESYTINGTIEQVFNLTTFYYLKVDAGLKSTWRFLGDVDGDANVKASSFTGIPNFKLPADAVSAYDDTIWRQYEVVGLQTTVRLNAFSFDNQRRHLFLYGAGTDGGSFVSGGGDVSANATQFYEANEQNLNQPLSTDPPWTLLGEQPNSSNIQQLITSGFAPFTDKDLGRHLSIVSSLSLSAQDDWTAAGLTSEVYSTTGDVTLTTEGGTWEGEIVLESRPRGTDDNAWEVLGSIVSNGDYNGTFTRYIAEIGIEIRVRMESYVIGTCSWSLSMPNGDTVIYKIVKVISSNTVIVRVESGSNLFLSNFRWSMGAFGGDAGYPAVWCIHEERLIYGSTLTSPFLMWGSEVNNWVNFTLGSLVTSPITFRLLSDNVTQIKWLLSKSSRLYIGTDFGEYVASTPDKDTVISGENPPRITLATPYGSSRQNAIAVDDEVVHVVGDRLTVRAITEKEYTTSETSKSLTVFNPEIAVPSIKEIHLARNPYPVVWCLRSDGKLVPFTYDLPNNVLGWAEMELTNSDIKSHWIIPNDEGIDEVYFIDQRDDIAVIARSSDAVPDVGGIFVVSGTMEPPEVSVLDAGTSIYNGGYTRQTQGFWENGDFVNIQRQATQWEMRDGAFLGYLNNNLTTIPPKGEWSVASGAYPVAFVEYEIFENGNYGLAQLANGTWVIFDATTYQYLFENLTDEKVGVYTPVSGSGATGTVEIIEVHFQIEKLKYVAPTVSAQNRDLNEIEYTSLVELSTITQTKGRLASRKQRVVRIILNLIDSHGGEVSADGGATWQPIQYDSTDLFTGEKEVRVNSGNTEAPRIMIRVSGIDPFHLISVEADVDEQGTEAR